MKNIIKIITISLLLFSCKKEFKDKKNVEIIDISTSCNKKEKINLSNLVVKIEYIQLETDSTCLLGRINDFSKKIQFSKSQILIADNSNKLYAFDYSGDFLNKIGDVGKGPGEYLSVDEFALFSNDNFIAVYCIGLEKALIYNKEGKYKNDVKVDFWPLGLLSFKDDLMFVNTLGQRKFSDYYNLSIVSRDGILKKRLFYKPKEKEQENNKTGLLDFMGKSYYLNDTLHYFEKNSYETDTIWKITSDYKTIPKYVIEIGGIKMPLEEHTESNLSNLGMRMKFNVLEDYQESTRYIFFRNYYANEKRLHHLYYDKLSKKTFCAEYKKVYGKGINLSFHNDIDGGFPFWPVGKVSDNKMFMLVYGYEIKDYIERRGDNYEAIDPKARDRLLKLVENSKISDNPILMIVTLKE